ncbi:MAG TPA: CvpA family protein [Flavobacteriales bacterium]
MEALGLNWLDLVLLALVAFAAVRGFMRGAVVEVCALVGLVSGLWAAVHFNNKVAVWIGLDADQEVLSFIVTFLGVLLAVNLLGRAITAALDLAQLGLANKIAGTLFGMVRSAFMLSVLLNIAWANSADRAIPDRRTRNESRIYAPLRSFAPALVPALGETKWMRSAWEAVKGQEPLEPERVPADSLRTTP